MQRTLRLIDYQQSYKSSQVLIFINEVGSKKYHSYSFKTLEEGV